MLATWRPLTLRLRGEARQERVRCTWRKNSAGAESGEPTPPRLALLHPCPQPHRPQREPGPKGAPVPLGSFAPLLLPRPLWSGRLTWPCLSHLLPSLLSSCGSLPTAFWNLPPSLLPGSGPSCPCFPFTEVGPSPRPPPTDKASDSRVQPCVSMAGRGGSGVLPPTSPAAAAGREAWGWGLVYLRAVPCGRAGSAGRWGET